MYNQRLDICRKDEEKYKGMENKKTNPLRKDQLFRQQKELCY